MIHVKVQEEQEYAQLLQPWLQRSREPEELKARHRLKTPFLDGTAA